MKNKTKAKTTETEVFVKQIMSGKSVNAQKTLERILKKKAAKRIKDTLGV